MVRALSKICQYHISFVNQSIQDFWQLEIWLLINEINNKNLTIDGRRWEVGAGGGGWTLVKGDALRDASSTFDNFSSASFPWIDPSLIIEPKKWYSKFYKILKNLKKLVSKNDWFS